MRREREREKLEEREKEREREKVERPGNTRLHKDDKGN